MTATEDSTSPGVGRVLVVDDDEGLARFIVEVLTDAGHHAEAVSSAALARRRVEATGYDVVVTDLRMPGVLVVDEHAAQLLGPGEPVGELPELVEAAAIEEGVEREGHHVAEVVQAAHRARVEVRAAHLQAYPAVQREQQDDRRQQQERDPYGQRAGR